MLDVAGCLETCGGSMSFKFNIGDKVVPILSREMGIPVPVSMVTALKLHGRVEIWPQGEPRPVVVNEEFYELFEESEKALDIEA